MPILMVNRDGFVNSEDLNVIVSDAFNYATSYGLADLNGDGYNNLRDLVICDDNSFNAVQAKKTTVGILFKPSSELEDNKD